MNKIIIKNNKQCQLDLSDNPEMLSKIRTLLSFKQEGAEYSIAFQSGWNGIICLLGKNNVFAVGLLNKVSTFLDGNQIPYQIVDQRKDIIYNNPIDVSKSLKKLKIEPRDYQLHCAEISMKHRNGIFRAVTASGKSYIIALIVAKHNMRTIVYVPALDLLDQFHKTLSSLFKEKIGRIGGGECDIQRINVATVQTIGRALEIKGKFFDDEEFSEKEKFNIENKLDILKCLKETELHFIDECHSATNATIKGIYKYIDPVKLFGCSGTPDRGVPSDIVTESVLGPQIINITAKELIDRKIIAQPIIKFINIPPAPIHGRTYPEVYSQYIVENDMRNEIILNQTKDLIKKGYSPLVLFRTIKHGDILYKLFQDNNIKCALLSGKDSLEKRNKVKDDYNNEKINVIISSSIFEIGVDIPKLNSYINASGQKSRVKTLQKVGRCLRAYPGKKQVAIVEFIDNCRYLNKHSKMRRDIYQSEDGFIVKYPNEVYYKGK